jgi:acetyl esterase/lipase
MRAFILGLMVLLLGQSALAQATQPPLEAYGELPTVRMMTLSPDGRMVAFVIRRGGQDVITTYDVETHELKDRMGVDNISTRDIWFADDDHLILNVSDAKFLIGYRGAFEYSLSYSLNLKTNTSKPLLSGSEDIYAAQSGLGKIIGLDRASGQVLMPAYTSRRKGRYSSPSFELFRVDLDTGRGRLVRAGTPYAIDWFVDQDGTVLAREEYDNEDDIYRIYSDVTEGREPFYEVESSRPPFSLIGAKPDRSALILVTASRQSEGFDAVFELGFDGKISGPELAREGADIEQVFKDHNRFVEGFRYSGAFPSYHFFDPALNADVQALVERFKGGSVEILGGSRDWNRILFSLFDGYAVPKYVVLDRTTGELTGLLNDREGIPNEAIGEVLTINYTARDGLVIPSILTLPAGVSHVDAVNLPMIVMPHGGPEAYDAVTFDWMAQYFANRGYLVLQPNFRGSSGSGWDFVHAGYGEWGHKMQDDVSDGVAALVKNGMADPQRVCIVGASYGGYSALAGGAYTPDLYKCVVAIAPVTDLRRMIRDVGSRNGQRHWAVDYWKDFIGDPKAQKVELEAISPANSAETFKAPVLLIHGKDDTVVPINQSYVMQSALKKAGKDVTFIELKGEDHWLSDGDTRIETLRAMSDFVEANIGAR